MQNKLSVYNETFYAKAVNSYASAKKYANILKEFYVPKTVIDIGCGKGAWLKAFLDIGVQKCVGVDGNWNNQSSMIDEQIEFHSMDLEQPIRFDCKFDLAICVEVAEHLGADVEFNFVDSLTLLADVIIFGAAYIEQGGAGHINENYHTHWEYMFDGCGFDVFDCFRPRVWGDDEVDWWYQQNTFLYVKKDCQLYKDIKQHVLPIANKKFMNAIHPYLYAQKIVK